MTTTPIADGLDTKETSENSDRPRRPLSETARDIVDHGNRPNSDGPVQDFMVDLIDAQQNLIAAQHTYLHDSNIGALASAQHGFIGAQAKVLERLRVFG